MRDKMPALSSNARKISIIPFSGDSAIRLKSVISFQNIQLSGLLIVKQKGDTVIGAFINEFGIKGFDFVVYSGNCKLMSLMNALDKWYIRGVLCDDLAFIFTTSNRTVNIDSIQNESFNSGKLIYKYWFNSNNNLYKVERFVNDNRTGELTISTDNKIVMNNTKRALVYQMSIIENNNIK